MAEKVAKLGIGREKDFMYYVKDGGVWKVQRKQPGVPKGRPEKVADGGFEMDTNYIYFVDRDGDVSRAKRAVGDSESAAEPENEVPTPSKNTTSAPRAMPDATLPDHRIAGRHCRPSSTQRLQR